MNKLLSIIIPVYNGESYIETLVDSIEKNNQDIVGRLEIILIDDGSKDDSLDVCKVLSEKYTNIVVLSKNNEGIAATREYGVNHSSGRFITFCDQDDMIICGYSTFIKKMEENCCEMLISNFNTFGDRCEAMEFIHEDAVYESPEIRLILAHLLNHELVAQELFMEKRLPDVSCSVWNCIFAREFILDNNIHFMKFVDFEDDWTYIISTLSSINRLYASKNGYYRWNINFASESHTYKFIQGFFNKREKLLKWTCEKLLKLDLGKEKEDMFVRTFRAQSVIRGFYMFCELKYSLYKREVGEISQFGDLNQYRNTTFLGGKKRIISKLLNHRLYFVAYYLNNYMIKKILQ